MTTAKDIRYCLVLESRIIKTGPIHVPPFLSGRAMDVSVKR